jgi:dienelactone hydrolase
LILAGLICLGVVTVLAAAVSLWIDHDQPVTLPAPSGPYPVGRVRYDWGDTRRREGFSQDPASKRKLAVWIWYPAGSTSENTPARYLPGAWQRAREQDMGIGAGFFTQNLSNVHAHAFENVPIADSSRPFPVIVMQPGLGPIASDYTTFAEDLTSRGYVVVASTPAYSANTVAFLDGEVIFRSDRATVPDSAGYDEAKARLDELILTWAADNQFVMDQLQRIDQSDPDGRFTGKLNLSKIGLFGHSFGGASAAETCHLDARCKAGVDLDGTPYGDVVKNGLSQPFLFLWSQTADPTSRGDMETAQEVRSILGKSSGKIYQFEVEGMRHFNFSDYAVEYQPVLKLTGGLGSIDGRRGLKIATSYVAAFFDQELMQSRTALLVGASSDFPEVQVVR